MPGEGGDPQATADLQAEDGRGHDASQCQEGRRHPAWGQEAGGRDSYSSQVNWWNDGGKGLREVFGIIFCKVIYFQGNQASYRGFSDGQ